MPSAAILAGGQATRFGGRDKSALVVSGRSILDRQCHELAQIVDEILIVDAAATPRRSMPNVSRATGGLLRVRHVVDRVPNSGPLAALEAALTAAVSDPVLVVACDMPFVTARFLNYLLSLAGEADAVVPQTEDGYHPLCAVYTRACRSIVTRHLDERRLSMTEVLKTVRVRVVLQQEIAMFGDPGRLLANVNTPTALDDIDQLQSHET